METQAHRPHRAPQAGPRARRKKQKELTKKGVSMKGKNLKAFTFASAVRAQRSARRNMDRGHRKEHFAIANRADEVPAPYVVVIVGPPGVGKSTLVRSLIKHYTKQNLRDVKGPVTVITGKKRRLTFFECPNDITAMIDLAKIADLVLLLVDASFGFEMQTFEFLNILKIHGFPKVMGVLTHLDGFTKTKQLNACKKKLKHRFWTEIVDGAKVFFLSGLINGRYPKREMINLARFISVTKFRPLIWKNSHPFVLADRYEDLTDPALVHADPKTDRKISFYGYVRGTYLKPKQSVHIMGLGDYQMSELDIITDPCPALDQQKAKVRRALNEKEKKIYAPMADLGDLTYDKDAMYIDIKKHQLNYTKTEDLIVDEDEETTGKPLKKSEGPGEDIIRNLQDLQTTIDERMAESTVRLFKGSAPMSVNDVKPVSSPDADELVAETQEDIFERMKMLPTGETDSTGQARHQIVFDANTAIQEGDTDDEASDASDYDHNQDRVGTAARIQHEDDDEEDDEDEEDEDDDEDEDEDGREADEDDVTLMDIDDEKHGSRSAVWKGNLIARATSTFNKRVDIMELVYGKEIRSSRKAKTKAEQPKSSKNKSGKLNLLESDDDESDDGDFFKVRKPSEEQRALDEDDSSKSWLDLGVLQAWDEEEVFESIRDKFVTGNWNAEEEEDEDGEEDMFGSDEDGSDANDGASMTEGQDDSAPNLLDPEAVDHGITVEDESGLLPGETPDQARERREKAKAALKNKFDSEYDSSNNPDALEEVQEVMAERKTLNQTEFAEEDEATRFHLEGAVNGRYVRIVVDDIPYEFVRNFDLRHPLVLGGLLPSEQNLGMVRVRFKRHRWSKKKVLKSNDPLVFSLGWRRFQSMPLFSIEDNGRLRFLKYTPEHLHCIATFYGPITPPNTGILAIQSLKSNQSNFRTAGTGNTLGVEHTTKIVKKLKLTGSPFKIFKHTAYIKDMFSSDLEVSKFTGCAIRTVSGIRGQIKKALTNEGKPGSYRATFEDKILKSDIVFCRTWTTVDPVKYYNPVTSLLLADKSGWVGMRNTAMLRRAKKKPIPYNADSEYKTLVRPNRKFAPMRISNKLQAELPFKLKPKLMKPRASNKPTLESRRAVIMSPEERKRYRVMQQLATLRNDKVRIAKAYKQKRLEKRNLKMEKDQAKRDVVNKEKRKRKYRAEGKGRIVKQKRYGVGL